MRTRAGTTRTFTISFPPDLADQVERLAARESRTTSELFRDPTSGLVMRVWVDRSTGQRRYLAEGVYTYR